MNSPSELFYCRFCAGKKKFDDLLDLEENPEDIEACMEKMKILKIDFINILSCKLPKLICETCYNALYDASLFICHIKQGQIILNELIDSKSEVESTENKPGTGEAQSHTDDSDIGDPDLNTELEEDPLDTIVTTCDINENTIEDLNTSVVSSETREEDIAEEDVASDIIQNYNLLDTSLHNNKNICDKDDLVEKGLLKTTPDVSRVDVISNNPYPILRSRLECILKGTEDNKVQDSCPNSNDLKQILSNSKTINGHEGNTAESVNSVDDILYCVNVSDNKKGPITVTNYEVLEDSSLKLVNHDDIRNISEDIYPKEMLTVNKNEFVLKEQLNITNQNDDQDVFMGLAENDEDYWFDLQDKTSWSVYTWLCKQCDTNYRSENVEISHSKQPDNRCCTYKCIDCPDVFTSLVTFIEHVKQHKKSSRKFCMYCNKGFKGIEELNQHIFQHTTSQQRPCNMCGQILDNDKLVKHKRIYYRQGTGSFKEKELDINLAPVQPKKCRPRRKISLSVDDLTCKTCSKFCETITKLKRHVMTHDESRPRDWVCHLCGRAFFSQGSLTDHIKKHGGRTEVCQVCSKKFYTRHQLKGHIVIHFEDKLLICDKCGANFKTKRRLKSHLLKHTDIKPFQCSFCVKKFRNKHGLKLHEHQHTGMRPYCCEHCERTFTNWPNCNKHMIRKHGIRLAKTKLTEHGRLTIDRKTGEALAIATDMNAKEWLTETIKPDRKKTNATKSPKKKQKRVDYRKKTKTTLNNLQ